MSSAWPYIALTLVADGLAGLAGGLLSERWLARHQAALVGFAAGAILAAVFLDVLPESLAAFGPAAFPWAFGGFVALACLEWLLGHHHRHAGAPPATLPLALLASDALHNVSDGAAVAAAFLVSPRAGLGVALAVVAHEVPQEVGDFALLRAAGYSRGRALFALAAVQLTAAIGAVGVMLAAGEFRSVTGATLSLAAGTLLYIGATDLLPELHAGQTTLERRERMIGFACGTLLVIAGWAGSLVDSPRP